MPHRCVMMKLLKIHVVKCELQAPRVTVKHKNIQAQEGEKQGYLSFSRVFDANGYSKVYQKHIALLLSLYGALTWELFDVIWKICTEIIMYLSSVDCGFL